METYIKLYDWMIQSDELKGITANVYALISQMSCDNAGGFWGTYEHMARRLRTTKRSCISAVNQLVEIGAVEKRDINGRKTLLAIPSWADYQIKRYHDLISGQKLARIL